MADPKPSVNIKVTVITVVKNAGKTIGTLFNSVRHFKNDDVEFIVMDGLSNDDTVDIIKQNEDIIDRWLSEPDNGIYDAMNKAVELARGEWLIFMGADDELLPGFKQMVSLLKEEDTIYYGNVFFHNTVITGEIKSDYMLTKTNICHQAIFYHRNVFKKYRYQTEYVKCADYMLNLNLWDDPAFKFVYYNCLIANFPKGGFSTYTTDETFEKDKNFLFKKHLKATSYYHYLNHTYGFWAMLKKLMSNNSYLR